jgi:hypothetical protein
MESVLHGSSLPRSLAGPIHSHLPFHTFFLDAIKENYNMEFSLSIHVVNIIKAEVVGSIIDGPGKCASR